MEMNFLALLVAAFTSSIIGFVWYHPKVFGTIISKELAQANVKIKVSNRILIFGISIIYAFFIAFILQFLVIHQFGAMSMTGGDVAAALPSYSVFMSDYGTAFRTFKHGALHGFMTGLFMLLPVTGINSLHHTKNFKVTLVTGGFWIVSATIMGGIICAM